MSAPGQRKLAKARRPTIPLTGAENVMLVDMGRILHYGIQYFLLRDNIRAIFGDRVAQSKKLRKEKLKDIVKNAMKAIMYDGEINKDNMTLDEFINRARDLIIALKDEIDNKGKRSASDNSLRKAIRELGKMESSPQDMQVIVPVKDKRKKAVSPQGAAAAAAPADVAGPYRPVAAADVAGPYRPAAAVVPAPAAPAVAAARVSDDEKDKGKKPKVDPLAHQIDFLTNLMRQTTDSAFYTRTGLVNNEQPRQRRPHEEVHSNPFTSRVVLSGFNAAIQQDREAIARAQIAAEEARRTEALRNMRQGLKDITDMFGKSKM